MLTYKRITFGDAEKSQMEFQLKLSSLRMTDNKSNKQLSEIENIMNFEKSQEEVINFYNAIIINFSYDSKHGKGLKILTLKQVLQRLPITLAKVKAGSTSENLLNEIFQVLHSLYQEKKITKKVCNNIMNSIKL